MRLNHYSLLIAACLSFPVCCQVLPFSFSAFSEPYQPLTTATAIDEGMLWDDPFWTVPLGFNFDLMGQSFNEIYITAPGCQVLPGLPDAQTVGVIMPYFADIINADFTEYVSPVRYLTEGPPGQQIFKIEWVNAGFWVEGFVHETYNNTTNFQLWLYEGSNDFEVRFGPNSVKEGELVHFEGKPTLLVARNVTWDGENWDGLWTLKGNPASPEVLPIANYGMLNAQNMLNDEPADGQVYRFATGMVSIDEPLDGPSLSIYPTLVDEMIIINRNRSEQTLARVMDMSGRLVDQWTVSGDSGIYPVSGLSSGTYLILIDGHAPVRIVKK